MSSLSTLFAPRSIALVGASDSAPWTQLVLDGLDRVGYAGDLHLVNGRGRTVGGRATVTGLAQIGGPVDLAYLLVPEAAVERALGDATAAGIRNIVVLASGFTEAGAHGAHAEQRLREAVVRSGLHLIGPNGLGFVSPHDRVALFPPLARRSLPPAGSVAMVSQSGGIAAEALDLFAATGVGLSLLVSTGNEAGVDVAEVIDHLVGDPRTGAICLFLETVRRPRAFLDAARRASEAGKPVIALKVGRSAASARTVAAHTGALVGDDRATRSAFASVGVVAVDSLEEAVLAAAIATTVPPPAVPAIAAAGISGGACSVAADAADRYGVTLADLAPRTVAALSTVLPSFGSVTNPLDATGAAVSNPAVLEHVLTSLRADPGVGLVLAQVPIPVDGTGATTAMLDAAARATRPDPGRAPVALCPGSAYGLPAGVRERAREHGLPILPGSMTQVVRAVALMSRWWARPHATAVSSPPSVLPRRDLDEPWSEEDGRQLLRANGIPVAPATIVTTSAAAVAAAAQWDEPVALKLVSPHIPHKSDVGGVHLGLVGPADVARGFAQVAAVLADRGEPPCALVGPMRPDGIDLIVGVVRDAQWGPVLAVGLGGVWTEVLDDVSTRLLPVDVPTVRTMLDDLRARAALAGGRGHPPAPLHELAQVITRIGDLALALGPRLTALEINPLRIVSDSVEALDVVVTLAEPGPST
ncbi:acetate--CoA ligase family protein [Nocardioides humi]|uniref:Acetate--CoA ligase family protein n=1 Tax=Nocardioides humi TaxID=449461 RepID=A0ABN2AF71_9ACTN|nr:acetate--CoA ligase family protein [Nocardioides humi]